MENPQSDGELEEENERDREQRGESEAEAEREPWPEKGGEASSEAEERLVQSSDFVVAVATIGPAATTRSR